MSRETQNRFERLTRTPVPRLICSLAVPTILSMLVTGIYNSADTYFVGRISTQATAAVGLVFSVMTIIQAMGFFCGQGSGNYLARLLGAGKRRDAEEIAMTGLFLAFLLGLFVALFGNLFALSLARLLGATEESQGDTVAYLRIILLGAPVMMSQFVINNQLRFQGSANYAVVGLMLGAVVNIGLDPLLIFGFHLGVPGAAIATVCGQCVSFLALLAGSRRGENIRLQMRNLRFTPANLLQIVNGGLPSLLRQGLTAISAILLNRMAKTWGGDAAIAGMSIVTRTMGLLSAALIGFGQGYQPVCSYNYGAGLYSRVREGYLFCVRVGTAFMAVLGALCFWQANRVVGFFRDDPQVILIGAGALRWQSAMLPLMVSSILTNMMLQASGQGLKSSFTSAARTGYFFIPLILLLPRFLGLRGVEMAQALADLLSFLLCVPIGRLELRRMGPDRPVSPS